MRSAAFSGGMPGQSAAQEIQMSGIRQIRRQEMTMADRKKQVKPAPKKDTKKTLKGAKKLGETKLMTVI